MTTVAFDAVWTGDGFRCAPSFRIDGDLLRPARDDSRHALRVGGTLFPRLTDHHVHLGLIDATTLVAGGITHVIDLGWTPAVAAGWLADDPSRPSTAIAGALLTAPGGYPSRSGWAPRDAAREVGGARDGRAAVREQVMAGASCIKVALNSDAGQTVDDVTLRAIVEEAARAGLPVVVHAQGVGQVERAVRVGVDRLAHAPFSERVPDAVIADAVRSGMSWISTLDIHGWGTPSRAHGTAVDNLRRFHTAGGRVLYGTDLGNGPLPLGPNARELAALLEAELDATTVLRAIAGAPGDDHLLRGAPIGPLFAWVPESPPVDPSLLPEWLATARGLRTPSLDQPLPTEGMRP
ncbi:amidohydrolase family protein [Leifsonia aquatica]|uniref:amidohydrolase family protein n=1 Tax=Leifsonia aquatica TaxID=144185 RepID=UPI000468486B|nr:amidohydrolase family protein [Leifsonia aquatica]